MLSPWWAERRIEARSAAGFLLLSSSLRLPALVGWAAPGVRLRKVSERPHADRYGALARRSRCDVVSSMVLAEAARSSIRGFDLSNPHLVGNYKA
jgi:hypothetical protein